MATLFNIEGWGATLPQLGEGRARLIGQRLQRPLSVHAASLPIMGMRTSGASVVCGVALAIASLSSCSDGDSKLTASEQRAAHLDRVREAYRLGRSEGLSLQQRKIAAGTAPADATADEQDCAARWDQLGEEELTAGDRDGFLAACSSFPPPGMPGYDEAVAEARGSAPTP